MEIKLELNESRESLWERFYSFIEDQLLVRNGDVSHEGVKVEANEEFTPTLQNVLVTCWLHAISPDLPSLVKQRFSTQLRANTIFSIREEISDAIPSLLAEADDRSCSISRTGTFQRGRGRGRGYRSGSSSPSHSVLGPLI